MFSAPPVVESPDASEPVLPGPPGAVSSRRKFDSLEQEAFLNLWRTFDSLKSIEEEVFGRFELSAQQYNALRLLEEAAPATLPTLSLAGRLVSRAPDITRLLDRLEARGLVQRVREAHNRRIVQVGLTAAGAGLLARMRDVVRDCGVRQLGHLGAERLHALIALLKTAREPHEHHVP
jgi:DNA-binding MarR family transcriptional regulator